MAPFRLANKLIAPKKSGLILGEEKRSIFILIENFGFIHGFSPNS